MPGQRSRRVARILILPYFTLPIAPVASCRKLDYAPLFWLFDPTTFDRVAMHGMATERDAMKTAGLLITDKSLRHGNILHVQSEKRPEKSDVRLGFVRSHVFRRGGGDMGPIFCRGTGLAGPGAPGGLLWPPIHGAKCAPWMGQPWVVVVRISLEAWVGHPAQQAVQIEPIPFVKRVKPQPIVPGGVK